MTIDEQSPSQRPGVSRRGFLGAGLGAAGVAATSADASASAHVDPNFAEIALRPHVTSASPSMAYVLRRREDQLWLRFDFYNLSLDGNGKLVTVDPDLDAVMVIGFPSQTIFEQAVTESSIATPNPATPPTSFSEVGVQVAKSAVAGLGASPVRRVADATPSPNQTNDWSRLAFTIPPTSLPLTFGDDQLLDWATRAKNLGLQPRLVAAATESGLQPSVARGAHPPTRIQAAVKRLLNFRSPRVTVIPQPTLSAPDSTMTALELPWWILVSPNQWAAWRISPTPGIAESHNELWHLRLGVLNQAAALTGGSSIDTSKKAGRTIRAVWSRDNGADATDPFASNTEVLTKEKRKAIVSNSAAPQLVLAPATNPIEVNNLMLSPLGGWLDVEADWPSAASLVSWRHRSTMGRDHFVKTAEKGYLLPFGHECVKTTVSERKIWPTKDGRFTAVIVQRVYIDITQPIRHLAGTNPAMQRRMPFTQVELLTHKTPDLLEPSVPPYVHSKDQPHPPFIARTLSKELFEFKARGTDLEGKVHEFSMPMAFVDARTGGTTLANFIQATYGYRNPGKLVSNGPSQPNQLKPLSLSSLAPPASGSPLPFFGGYDPSAWSDVSRVRSISLRGSRFKVMTEPPGTPSMQSPTGSVTPDNTSVPLHAVVLDFDWDAMASVAVAMDNKMFKGAESMSLFLDAAIPGVRYFVCELESVGAIAGVDHVLGAFEYTNSYLTQQVSQFCGTYATAVCDAPNLLVPLLVTGASDLLQQPDVANIVQGATDFAASLGNSVIRAASDRLGGMAAPNSAIAALSSVLGPVQGAMSTLKYVTEAKKLYDDVKTWEQGVLSDPVDWATKGFPFPPVPDFLAGPLNAAVQAASPTGLIHTFQDLGQALVQNAGDLEQKAASFLSDGLTAAERYADDLASGVDHVLSGSILGGPSINDLIGDTKHVLNDVNKAIDNALPKGMTIERVKDNSLDALVAALSKTLSDAGTPANQLLADEKAVHQILDQIKASDKPDLKTLEGLQATIANGTAQLPNLGKLTLEARDAITKFSIADALKVHFRLTWVPMVPLVYDDAETYQTVNGKKGTSATTNHLPFVTYLDEAGNDSTSWGNKPDVRTTFSIRADSVLSLNDPSSSTFETRAEIKNLTLRIPTADVELLRVPVKSFVFTAGKGQQASFDPSFGAIGLMGPLKFIEELATMAKSDGFSVKVGTQGVVAAFATDLPSVSVGVFALKNMSFGANATIPFDGSPVRVGMNFCTKDKPFALTIYTFAGGGYFTLGASFRGIENFDASFEFGAQAGFDIAGIVTGSIFVKGGVHYSYDLVNKSVFHAFIHLGGNASVMAIASASIDLSLDLGYESATNKWTGTATLSVSVSVLFFSFSDSFEVHRAIGGDDPTFSDEYSTPALYNSYCAAFA